MITEDYVSFETAKLLKEKGFDENCSRSYVKDKLAVSQGFNNSYYTTMYSDASYRPVSAPTLQMAMKWLREVHKLYCDIRVGDGDFVIDIMSLKDGEFGCEVVEPECCVYLTYEEACEAAIKHCLENLI